MPDNNNLPAITYYTPVELTGIYRSYFERSKSNNIVWLRGIYVQRPNQNRQWATAFDELRDVSSNNTVTLKINWNDRSRLKNNSLVLVGGLIDISSYTNGTIQISVNVSRFEIIKDQFVTEQDIKRQEIRIKKSKKGFRNVDALLEEKLFKDERPKVALVFAQTSITMSDFNAGVNAAAAKIDFVELRQSFGNPSSLVTFLKAIDMDGYDVIALIRGGGNGIEALDDIDVLSTISQLATPTICAIGHVGEELFLKSIADKVASTPNGLGQYFSEMVERIIAKRNDSRAVLVKQVEMQFKKQIEDSNTKNKELLKQIENLRKQAEQQTKTFKETLEKQILENKEALKKLELQNKTQLGEVLKSHKETLTNLTEQNKQTNKQLEAARNTNMELQRQLSERGNKAGIYVIIAIISLAVGFVISRLL